MSEFMRQAQAPTNSNPEAAPVAPTDTPDHVQHDGETFDNTSLRDAHAQGLIEVPNTIPVDVARAPHHAGFREMPTQEAAKDRKSSKWLRTAGVLGGLAGLGVIGYNGFNLATGDGKERLNTPPAPAASPDLNEYSAGDAAGESRFNIPGLQTLDLDGDGKEATSEDLDLVDPADYRLLPESMRVDDVAPKLNPRLGMTIDMMIDNIVADADRESDPVKKDFYNEQIMSLREPKLDTPRAQWSDQDYLSYHSAALYLATSQPNREEGERVLSVVINPENEVAFEDRAEILRKGSAIRNTYKAQEFEYSGMEIPSGTRIDGVDFDEAGGRYIKAQILSDNPDQGETKYLVFRNEVSESGDTITILEAVYGSRDNPAEVALANK